MTLQLFDWKTQGLLAKPVRAALEGLPGDLVYGVTKNADELADTYKWAAEYAIPLEKTANVVVVETRKTRNGERAFAAVLVLADSRADLNGLVKRTVEVSKVSFAPIEKVVEATGGMESGGMSPIGLPADWPLLIDERVIAVSKLYIGSGIRPSKLVVNGSIFHKVSNAQILPNVGTLSLV